MPLRAAESLYRVSAHAGNDPMTHGGIFDPASGHRESAMAFASGTRTGGVGVAALYSRRGVPQPGLRPVLRFAAALRVLPASIGGSAGPLLPPTPPLRRRLRGPIRLPW